MTLFYVVYFLLQVTEKQSTLLAEQAEMEKEAEVVLVAQDQAKV